jgi:hypothetical protein
MERSCGPENRPCAIDYVLWREFIGLEEETDYLNIPPEPMDTHDNVI